MEAGHVGENIYLQATALGLGTVVVGAFSDELVQKVLNLPKEQKPLYIIPVGRK
jgi:nitroreductase